MYINQTQLAAATFMATKRSRVVQLIMPMQSGKTGVMYFMSNFLLPKDIATRRVGFMCAMSYKDLRAQNVTNLEAPWFQPDQGLTPSNIKLIDAELFTKTSLLKSEIEQFEYLFVDECDYGSGDVGRMSRKLKEILNLNPKIKLILVSATPYEPVVSSLPMTVVQGKESYMTEHGYTGLRYFLNNNRVIDTKGKSATIKNKQFMNSISEFKVSNGSYYLVRVGTIQKASDLAAQLDIKTKIITMQTGIRSGIRELQDPPSEPTLVLIVNGLAAGVDLGPAKKNVWGVWETRKAVGSCAQGLPGRVCSFGDTKDCLIFASKSLLEEAALILEDYTHIKKSKAKLATRVSRTKEKDFARATTEVINEAEFRARYVDIDIPLFYQDKHGRYRKSRKAGEAFQFMMTSMSKGGATKKTSADARVGTKLNLFTDHFKQGFTNRLKMFKRTKAMDINNIQTAIFYNDYTNCVELGLDLAPGQDQENIKDKFIILTNQRKYGKIDSVNEAEKSMYNEQEIKKCQNA